MPMRFTSLAVHLMRNVGVRREAVFSSLLLLAFGFPAPQTPVLRLQVHASTNGLTYEGRPDGKLVPPPGLPSRADLVITCETDRCTSANVGVPVNLVEAFRTAVAQPAMDRIDLGNLGVGEEWARRLAADERARLERANSNQGTFWGAYDQRLRDCASRAEVVRELISLHYNQVWTDDDPGMTVSMTLSSGTTVEVSSYSQHAFMLPWKIATGGESRTTFDARISRALAALLPQDFVERERVAGEGLAVWYLEQFWHNSPAVCGGGAAAH